jgi:voltage-gated potassium channel
MPTHVHRRERIRKVSRHLTGRSAAARMARALLLQAGVLMFGTLGYWIGTAYQEDLLTCVYMSVVTLTTVGFGEVIPIDGHPRLMIFTIVLIIVGMGSVTYFVSVLTSFVLDGELRQLIQRMHMQKQIDHLSDHYIVAGLGVTGRYVLPDLMASNVKLVLIDHNRAELEERAIELSPDTLWLCGDATDDELLTRAGIERARGVVFSLGSDRDNLFAVVTARQLNPTIRIVTRGEDPRSERKFLAAGASSVVFTNVLGGYRMAAQVLQPYVADFLDLLRPLSSEARKISGLAIAEGDNAVGQSLAELALRKRFDVMVLAWKAPGEAFVLPPRADTPLVAGIDLVVLATDESLEAATRFLRTGA